MLDVRGNLRVARDRGRLADQDTVKRHNQIATATGLHPIQRYQTLDPDSQPCLTAIHRG